MKFWPGIPLVQAVTPVMARAFLGFGDVSGSEGIWEEVGACFIRIGDEVWVFLEFCRDPPEAAVTQLEMT